MLSDIRRNVRHPVLKIVLGIIALVFILYFGYSSRKKAKPSGEVAATVNGVKISSAEYEQTMLRLQEFYREITQGKVADEQLLELGGIRERALEMLVDRVLLAEEADRRGIEVTDEEVDAAIQSQPAFAENGRFNNEKYLALLARSGMRHAQYREMKRAELLMNKTEQAIRDAAVVTEADIEAEYRASRTKGTAEYVAFDPAVYAARAPVDDDKLSEYLKREEESFRTEEKRSARYVFFPASRHAADVTIGDQTLAEEYRVRAYQFQEKEAVWARHILVRVDADAVESAWDKARARIEEIRKSIHSASDFASVARARSEDPGSRTSGGDLGWFERGRMVPAFEDAAFRLAVGEVSEPVRTEFGYHLILVEERRAARQIPFEEAKERLLEILKLEQGRKLARSAADALLMDLEDKKVAWEKLPANIEMQTTPLIARLEAAPEVPAAEEFVPTLFALGPNAAGQLVTTPEGTYVIAVASIKPAGVPPLAEIRKSVEARYREAEGKKLAKADADALLAAAREMGWPEALRDKDLTSAFTEFFTVKSANIDPIGFSAKAANALLSDAEPGKIAPESYEIQDKVYALRLATVIPADLSGLDAEREKIRAQLLPSKREQVYEDEMKRLREAAEIEKNPTLFPPQG